MENSEFKMKGENDVRTNGVGGHRGRHRLRFVLDYNPVGEQGATVISDAQCQPLLKVKRNKV